MDINYRDFYHISIVSSLLSREFENVRHTLILFWWLHSCVILLAS